MVTRFPNHRTSNWWKPSSHPSPVWLELLVKDGLTERVKGRAQRQRRLPNRGAYGKRLASGELDLRGRQSSPTAARAIILTALRNLEEEIVMDRVRDLILPTSNPRSGWRRDQRPIGGHLTHQPDPDRADGHGAPKPVQNAGAVDRSLPTPDCPKH